MKKKLLVLLLCAWMCTGALSVSAKTAFTDVPADAWYASDVENAVSSGLINGKSDTQFAPEEYLTAAEAVKLAACLHQYAAEGRVTLKPGTLWYRTYVEYAWKNRVLDGALIWDQPADRRTFMKLFAHALPEDALPEVNTVVDNAIPDLSSVSDGAEEVYALYRAGILRGSDAQSSCKPDDPIRRSEAAAILTRMLDPSARLRFTLDTVPEVSDSGKAFQKDGWGYTDFDYSWALGKDGTLTLGGTKMYMYGLNYIEEDTMENGERMSVLHVETSIPWEKYSGRIRRVEVQSGFKAIGTQAFANCPNLSDVRLPEGLETIGESAFSGCRSLKSIRLPESLKKIDTFAFSASGLESVTVPEGIESVCDVFVHCKNLKNVALPSSLAYIDNDFTYCESLESIVIPEKVRLLRDSFYGCSSLRSVYFMGDLPEHLISSFEECLDDLTLYYVEGKEGWTSPTVTIEGVEYRTAVWNP